MFSLPISVALFVVSLFVSLISYIWATLSRRIERLEKCSLNPVTLSQIKEVLDARFNEFRLELFRSGVLKPVSKQRKKQEH